MSQHVAHHFELPRTARHRLRMVGVGFGVAWAAALLIAGLWIWDHQSLIVQIVGEQAPRVAPRLARLCVIFTIAAAQFVFLTFVADAVFPRASRSMRRFLKLLAAMLVFLSLVCFIYILADVLR